MALNLGEGRVNTVSGRAPRNIFLNPLLKTLLLQWVCFVDNIHVSIDFSIQSVCLCLLIGGFIPFPFKVIIYGLLLWGEEEEGKGGTDGDGRRPDLG